MHFRTDWVYCGIITAYSAYNGCNYCVLCPEVLSAAYRTLQGCNLLCTECGLFSWNTELHSSINVTCTRLVIHELLCTGLAGYCMNQVCDRYLNLLCNELVADCPMCGVLVVNLVNHSWIKCAVLEYNVRLSWGSYTCTGLSNTLTVQNGRNGLVSASGCSIWASALQPREFCGYL